MGGSKGRGYMYNYDWLVYSSNQHNIIKQFSSNLKKKQLRKDITKILKY